MKLEKLIGDYEPFLRQIRVIHPDGEIDLEVLDRFGSAAFDKQKTVKLWKLTFCKEDFIALMEHLRSGMPVDK